jgi:hypothetical protein
MHETKKTSASYLTSIGFVCSCIGIVFPFVFSVLGLVLSIIAQKRRKQRDGTVRQEYQTVGIILGSFGLVLWTLLTFLIVYFRGLR